jgi:hypothetical protein
MKILAGIRVKLILESVLRHSLRSLWSTRRVIKMQRLKIFASALRFCETSFPALVQDYRLRMLSGRVLRC